MIPQTYHPDRTDHVVTTETAAHLLGMSAIALARWRVTGTGPKFLKLGRSVRYRVGDLKTWMAEQEYGSTSAYRAAS